MVISTTGNPSPPDPVAANSSRPITGHRSRFRAGD